MSLTSPPGALPAKGYTYRNTHAAYAGGTNVSQLHASSPRSTPRTISRGLLDIPAQANYLPPQLTEERARAQKNEAARARGEKKIKKSLLCLRRGSDRMRHDSRSGHGNDATCHLLCFRGEIVWAFCLCDRFMPLCWRVSRVWRAKYFLFGEIRSQAKWLVPNSKQVYQSLMKTIHAKHQSGGPCFCLLVELLIGCAPSGSSECSLPFSTLRKT